MPDDLTQIAQRLARAKPFQGVELPDADELAQGLMTQIGVVGGIADIITATREKRFVKPGERPSVLPTPPAPLDPNKLALQEQVGKKPELRVEDRLPFLKGRDIDPKLRQPQQFLTETGDIVTEGETKREDLPFQQRALNEINNTLLQMNLHDSGIGELAREIITPIVAGGKRLQEGRKQLGELKPEGLGNIALGIAGVGFGTFMMPFGLARATGKQIGGETAGQIAELTALGLSGGIPLIAGYFASTGATELADRLMQGKDLTDKQVETVQAVVGLFAFVGGAKVGAKVKGKLKSKLQKKVEKYIDGIPDIVKAEIKPLNQPLRELRKELVTEKTGIQRAKIKKEQKAVETFTKKQKEIQNRKRDPKTGRLEKGEPTIGAKRPQVFEDNRDVIGEVLDKDPSLSASPLMISKRLTTLVEKGELKKKVSTNTIKEIADEWIANRQKTKVQNIKSAPVEERTVPHFFGKNTNPSIKELQKEFPNVDIKGKTYEQVVKDFRIAWENKKKGVEQPKKEVKAKENEGANLESLTDSGKQHLAKLIQSGVDKKTHYTEWSKKMVNEFGDGVKPQLLRTWSAIKKEFTKTPPEEPSGKKVRGFAKSTERRAIESGLLKEIKD